MGEWALYSREWLSVHGTPESGAPGLAECRQEFIRRFAGKISDGDWRIEQPDGAGWTFLLLALPVFRGEFGSREQAEDRAGNNGGRPHRAVPRDSAEEAALRDYGRRLLRA